MANVAEHDSEQERERDDGKQTRVHLLVRRDTVGIHDGLEALGELVRTMERGRRAIRAQLMKDGWNVGAGFLPRTTGQHTHILQIRRPLGLP